MTQEICITILTIGGMCSIIIIIIEEDGAQYEAMIKKSESGSSRYWVEYVYQKNKASGKKTKKKARWVDFELPSVEGTSCMVAS